MRRSQASTRGADWRRTGGDGGAQAVVRQRAARAGELVEQQAVEEGEEVMRPLFRFGHALGGEQFGHPRADPRARRDQGLAQLGPAEVASRDSS